MYYQNKNYKNRPSGQSGYLPRKPVKSFQDLEVYQITAGLAAVIVKRVSADRPGAEVDKADVEPCLGPKSLALNAKDNIAKKLLEYALDIPIQLAVAHSRRFGRGRVCLDHLEKAMLWCNLAAVYLEQYRDIVNAAIEHDFFEESVKKYLAVRGKILRLERSWEKFIEINREENKL